MLLDLLVSEVMSTVSVVLRGYTDLLISRYLICAIE